MISDHTPSPYHVKHLWLRRMIPHLEAPLGGASRHGNPMKSYVRRRADLALVYNLSQFACSNPDTKNQNPDTIKSTKIDKHRYKSTKSTRCMLRKSRSVFFQEKKAPAAAATQTQRAWGTLKSTKIGKHRQHPQNTCSKNPGACFFTKKKRLRQLRHRRKGLGDPETNKNRLSHSNLHN